MKNGDNLKKAPAKKISKLEKVRNQVSQSHSAFLGVQAMQAKKIKIENTNENKKSPQMLDKPLLILKK